MRIAFLLPVTVFSSLIATSDAASVFWSFQNSPTAASSSGNYNGPTTASPSAGNPTSVSGFQGSPDFTAIRGSGTVSIATFAGGANYKDPATGTVWEGNGSPSADPVGQTIQWGSGNAVATNAGAGFILSLNTTGLTGLSLRFDIRSATAPNSVSGRLGSITGFSSVRYRTSAAGTWELIAAATPTWGISGDFVPDQEIDLSQFTFLNEVETLELEFIFNGGAKTNTAADGDPAVYTTHNFRMDNLLVTAVPEPSGLGLLGLGAVALGMKRRR